MSKFVTAHYNPNDWMRYDTYEEILIKELEHIKAEIQELENTFYIETSVYDIIDKRISELKGVNNVL